MAQLLLSETGRAFMQYHEELGRWSQARKTFDLPAAGLGGELWIFLGQGEAATSPVEVRVNGKLAGRVQPAAKPTGFDWHCVRVRRGLMRRGRNEFVLSTPSDVLGQWMLGVALGGRRARNSAVSLDGGRTWHDDAMGPHRLAAGEYLVRLYLPDLPDPAPVRPRFVWEDFDHPQLAAMRRALGLSDAIKGKRHTFDKVRALSSLVAKLWKVRVGDYSPSGRPAKGTMQLVPWNTLAAWSWMKLDNVQAGQRPQAFCVHYGIAMVQCCAAVGIYARGVVTEKDLAETPSGHFCAEVWIPEWEQWVFVDPDHDKFYRVGDRYLTLAEISDLQITGRFDDEVTIDRGPSYGYDPRIAGDGREKFDHTQGHRRWGIYPRTDFLTSPAAHPVQHGQGDYRFTGFYWYRDPRLEPRHYFPHYFDDLAALYAPPPRRKAAGSNGRAVKAHAR